MSGKLAAELEGFSIQGATVADEVCDCGRGNLKSRVYPLGQ